MIQAEEFTGELLKTLRQKYKLTQKEVAQAIGTDRERISEWEHGKKNMSRMTKTAFKNFFERFEK